MNEIQNIPLNKDKSICNQQNCFFLVGENGGCQPCKSCNAGPTVITNNCVRCWKCVNIPGECRWADDPEISLEQQEAESEENEIEVTYEGPLPEQ